MTTIGDDNEFIVAAACTSLYLSQQLVLCCVSITMFNRRKKENNQVKLYVKGRQSFGAYNTWSSGTTANLSETCTGFTP